jgi:glycosyltransferase involved in cell wall biosynthesis
LKILLLIHTLGHGGAENTFRWLARGLRESGIDAVAAIAAPPSACGPGAENWLGFELERMIFPVVKFNRESGRLRLIREIVRLVKTTKPDLVHSHLLDSNFYSAIACRMLNLPHISTEHGDVSFNDSLSARFKYALIGLCSRHVACVSEAILKKAKRRVFVGSKLQTVYNGICFMNRSPSSFRKEMNIPDDCLLIGNVGNLYPVKGQEVLLKSFARIHERYDRTALVIVGRGAEEHSLKRWVRKLGIPQEKVIFTGFRNDVQNIMNSFDLYVQSSLSEGHPVALIEAMSLGVPVIATNVGGTSEVTMGGKYGLLVSPGSESDLEAAITGFFKNTDKLKEMADAGKIIVRERFSIERMVRNYIALYRQTVRAA